MNCLNCEGSLKEDITYIKGILGYYKVYNSFCLNCGYEKTKKIKICKEFYFNILKENLLKATNTTEKTYSQNYNKSNGVIA